MPSQLVNASARRRLESAMATGYPLPGLAIYRITLVLLSASLLTVYAFSWPHCSRSHIYTFIMYTVYSLRCSKRSHPARERACIKRSHSARGSGIWTLLPLVIAQKKMHLRGIELQTSSLECLGAAATTNQA
jgi:hypothetical protein